MELLRLEKLTKSFGNREILHGIDLEIGRGEYISIMGRSGCGKSTLLNIIGGIEIPSGGEYRFADRSVTKLTSRELAHFRCHSIGYVFQQFHLVKSLTVRENVEMPLGYRRVGRVERRTAALEALKRVGLSDKADAFPTMLSGGEAQRCAIARAIVGKPELLIADEPTGNLDSLTGELILELFDSLHRDAHTLIVVTHDSEVAKKADRRLLMADGRLEALL